MNSDHILPSSYELDPSFQPPIYNPYGQIYQHDQYYPPTFNFSPTGFHLSGSYSYENSYNSNGILAQHIIHPPEPVEIVPPPPPPQTTIYKSIDFFGNGRRNRPPKICVILRGLPGSGKSSLARQIRDIEKNYNVMTRILSIDDYFMSEFDDKAEAMMAKITNSDSVTLYASSLEKSLRRSVEDPQFDVLVVDACHAKIGSLTNLWALARSSGFEAVVAMLPADVDTCLRRMVTASLVARDRVPEVRKALVDMMAAWEETPPHIPLLDMSWLLGGGESIDVDMDETPETAGGGAYLSSRLQAEDSDEEMSCTEPSPEPHATSVSRLCGDAGSSIKRSVSGGKKRVRWASEVDVLILEADSGAGEEEFDGDDRSSRTSFQLNTSLSALCSISSSSSSSPRDADGDRLQAKRRRERHEEKRFFKSGLHSRHNDFLDGDA